MIELSENITIVRFFKSPTSDDIRNAIDDVSTKYPNSLRLWDLSESGLELSGAELRQISDYGKAKLPFPSKVAIIATKDLAYGLSRTYEVYRTEDESDTNVFRTVQQGLEWLRS